MDRTYVPVNSIVDVPYAGEWVAGAAIKKGEFRTKDGLLFMANLAHTSSAATAPYADPAVIYARQYRGVYSAATTYAKYDSVTSAEGNQYLSLIENNLAHTPPTDGTDSAYWACYARSGAQGPQGDPGGTLNWRGAYNAGTTYAANDGVISSEGRGCYCLQACTGQAPPSYPTLANAYWSVFAEKGGADATTLAGASLSTNIVANPGVDTLIPTEQAVREALTAEVAAYALLAGRFGGQTLCGGTDASEALTLASTYNATKGKIYAGPLTVDELNNSIGINKTSPSFGLDLVGTQGISGTRTNASENSLLIARKYTVTSDLNLTENGIYVRPLTDIANGKTLLGTISAISINALRNISGDGENAGTLRDLIGAYIWYGNYDNAAISPVTTNAYGIYIAPYYKTGTITNMYDLYLAAGSSGGTATNKWGIYQVNSKLNYFAGNIYTVGDVSAATFTDRTEAFLGDALAAIAAIRVTAGGEIDHSTLPEFALMPYQDENQQWWPGRSVNGMVSVLTKALQEVSTLLAAKDEQIAALEARLTAIEQRMAA